MTTEHNEKASYTAADMADQGARQFEAGYAAAKAELHAAAQEAVAYRLEVQTVGSEPFMQYVTDRAFIATLRNAGCKVSVTPLYTAPVTAAPGIDLEQFRKLSRDMRKFIDNWDTISIDEFAHFSMRLDEMIDASPKGDHFVDATNMVDSPKGGSDA